MTTLSPAIDIPPPLTASLIAAALAIGRMPGEPARVLGPPAPFARIFGTRRPGPLADPRLEVLRAISASRAKGIADISAELATAARRAGWTLDALRHIFPGLPGRACA